MIALIMVADSLMSLVFSKFTSGTVEKRKDKIYVSLTPTKWAFTTFCGLVIITTVQTNTLCLEYKVHGQCSKPNC